MIAELRLTRSVSICFLSLQWGRDQLIAELCLDCPTIIAAHRLQWGRDQLIAEFHSKLRP